jgi:hypothetical protein
LTADEWFSGKDADPKLISLEDGFQVKAKQEFVTSAPEESPVSAEPAAIDSKAVAAGSKAATGSMSSDEVRFLWSMKYYLYITRVAPC